MSDFRQWRKPTTVNSLHFAARNGQGHFQKLSSQTLMEQKILIMVGGNGMKQKVGGGRGIAYG